MTGCGYAGNRGDGADGGVLLLFPLFCVIGYEIAFFVRYLVEKS